MRNGKGLFGLGLVALGVAIVALNIRQELDPVILTLSYNHGIHLTDVVGSAVVAVGVALVWTRRSARPAAK